MVLVVVRLVRQALVGRSSHGRVYNLIADMEYNWDRALKWKPWGLKLAALAGSAIFWYDKVTDIILMKQVWPQENIASFVLLALFLFHYVISGCALVARVSTSLFSWRITVIVLVSLLVPVVSGSVIVAVLDVAVFATHMGCWRWLPNQTLDMEEYQLFRDFGRTAFGTIPTVILQSLVFAYAFGASETASIPLKDFVQAFVSSALQMLKTVGIVMYMACKEDTNMLRVVWQLFSCKRVVLSVAFWERFQPAAQQAVLGQQVTV